MRGKHDRSNLLESIFQGVIWSEHGKNSLLEGIFQECNVCKGECQKKRIFKYVGHFFVGYYHVKYSTNASSSYFIPSHSLYHSISYFFIIIQLFTSSFYSFIHSLFIPFQSHSFSFFHSLFSHYAHILSLISFSHFIFPYTFSTFFLLFPTFPILHLSFISSHLELTSPLSFHPSFYLVIPR